MSDVKGKILLVDDDVSVLKIYARQLERGGYEVVPEQDATKAVTMTKDSDFDLVVSDIMMPNMNGMELLRGIRQNDLDIPVILITGGPSIESAARAVELGAIRYLVKPVNTEDLYSAVAYAVRMRKLNTLHRETLKAAGLSDNPVSDRIGLSVSFDKALDTIYMAYQPIVSLKEGKISGFEALVRCEDCTFQHPGALFDAAEKLGRLTEIGAIIREHVAKTMAEKNPPFPIFVNLHPRDLLDPNLFDAKAPLAKFAKNVVLEITERASLEPIPDLKGRLESLREMGFRLAIDDLGAGYASLSTLAQLQPDVAKIDMSLVRNIHLSETKLKLVNSLITLCEDLGIQVITEGVETAEELNALKEVGCDLLQGFYFAKPALPFQVVEGFKAK